MTVGTRDASPHNYPTLYADGLVLFPDDDYNDDNDLHGRCVEKGKSELIARMNTVCMCKSPWDVFCRLFVRPSNRKSC